MLATLRKHVVNALQMGGEVVIVKEDVVDHFDTVFHTLECPITVKAVGVAGG